MKDSLTVLVVDTLPDAALSLKLLLELNGHLAFVADSVESAVESASRLRPDVFISEVWLRRPCEGLVLPPLLRMVCPKATLVALTTQGTEMDRVRSLAAGF